MEYQLGINSAESKRPCASLPAYFPYHWFVKTKKTWLTRCRAVGALMR